MKTALLLSTLLTLTAHAADCPEWGGGRNRNMVSAETGLPLEIEPGKKYGQQAPEGKNREDVDLSTTQNCLWAAKLGSQTYGTPVIANGRVYVGTNNEAPRNSKHLGDRGIVMVFDEKTGAFLWQMVCPKMGSGKVNDWEYLGICASPTIIGNRAYVPSNRCQIVCLDVDGLKNGNQGMTDEASFMAPLDKDGKPTAPIDPTETDADILWVYDMYKELGVFQHNATSGYPLIVDNKLFAPTCNGVDWTHTNIPAPQAPSFIMLNAEDGSLQGEMDHVASERVLHCSWSSPTYTEVDGKPQIIFAAGDGWVYSMAPETDKKDDFDILKEHWRFDANPPEYRKNAAGEPIKYTESEGPSEIIATPVVYDGLVYVAIGQDPEHGEGLGCLSCIDPKMTGDISGKAVWTFKDIERSISTCAIKDGLVYIADFTGRLFCLDAKTGKEYWRFDTKGHIWASPYVVEGRVYIGNEEGDLYILAEGKELKELKRIEFPSPLLSSAIAANGCLYITTHTHLYCFKQTPKP
jgi:outer membrane protein assembly factor BamB